MRPLMPSIFVQRVVKSKSPKSKDCKVASDANLTAPFLGPIANALSGPRARHSFGSPGRTKERSTARSQATTDEAFASYS